jgi:hypothetical protein
MADSDAYTTALFPEMNQAAMQSGSIGHFLSLVQPPINKYAEKSEDPGRSLFFLERVILYAALTPNQNFVRRISGKGRIFIIRTIRSGIRN